MIITALVDNIKLSHRTDLVVERGLSIHVNTNGINILFDVGSSNAFCDNARLLNIDISNVDAAIISHRHHDHCDGLKYFLHYNNIANVYFRECDDSTYSFNMLGFKRNVGINKDIMGKCNKRLTMINEMTEILPNIYVITKISNKFEQPKGNQYLFSSSGNGCFLDRFDHELLLIIKEPDGMVVFTGCAHHGILNMIETAVTVFPDIRIKAVVGGFHLIGIPLLNGIAATKQEIEMIANTILIYPINTLYTGHCTGIKAYKILKSILGEKIEYFPTGRNIVL